MNTTHMLSECLSRKSVENIIRFSALSLLTDS